MRFDVLTLFPEIFSGYLGQSLLRRAIDRGLIRSSCTTFAILLTTNITPLTIDRLAAGREWS